MTRNERIQSKIGMVIYHVTEGDVVLLIAPSTVLVLHESDNSWAATVGEPGEVRTDVFMDYLPWTGGWRSVE